MKAEKIRGLDEAEIKKQLVESDDVMFRIRFQMSMGQTDGLKKLRTLKKDRARMLTILRERELSAAAPSGQAAGDGKGK
jgi:large subunit ribosomal protein L29